MKDSNRMPGRCTPALIWIFGLVASLPAWAGESATPAGPQGAEAILQAERLFDLGDRQRAALLLESAIPQIDAAGDAGQQAIAYSLLAQARAKSGDLAVALPLAQRGVERARAAGSAAVLVKALDGLGLVQATLHHDDSAAEAYAEALRHAGTAEVPAEETAGVRSNAADLHIRRGEWDEAAAQLRQASRVLESAPASGQKVRLAVGLAERLQSLLVKDPDTDVEGRLALQRSLLDQAEAGALAIGDQRELSEALGVDGEAELRLGHFERSLSQTRAASFAAQAAQSPELLYRWQWQAARLFAGHGDLDSAMRSYRQAIGSLQPIRRDLLLDLRAADTSYRDTIGPLFMEFADLLLKHSAQAGNPDVVRRDLFEAREAVEQFKTVELEDYFKDDCVTRQSDIEHLPSGSAVLYPIILPDRLELLLSIGNDIERFTVPVSGEALSLEAVIFRKKVVKRTSQQYLPHAQQLYAWLIQPILPDLLAHNIDTLVVVPDGELLGIPFAALHDGHDFLLQRFAVATVPGLHLVEPRSAAGPARQALLSGLSVSVQGYPALPGVEEELLDVGKLYPSQMLDNQKFTVAAVKNVVDGNQFGVVHIASHGTFDREASKSFLLTYDGKMGMDTLSRLIQSSRLGGEPVDLLTLSACDTAAGDDRSALGLAGIALKAGARSVLATLWSVNDEASSSLVTDFYRELRGGGKSKAMALRAAQLQLLADERYRHPGYWAPFLMIGNWS
jgi:CHAT domain-containing protein